MVLLSGRVGPALAVALALGCGACGGQARPNLLLVVVDTLRADRLGSYGWHEPTSPHVDGLAREGVLFEQLHAQVPQTQPSFATLLTGTYPVTHGVRGNGLFALPQQATTLAELLHDAGYRTGAVVGGFPLDARFGLGQGFDDYLDEMKSSAPMRGLRVGADGRRLWAGHSVGNFESTAVQVADQAVHWLEQLRERPFFLMVHFFDPHHEYRPPEPFAHRFSHPYAGEVALVDRELGRLLGTLDTLGLAEDTLVVFTADHGECLGEWGRHNHQQYVTEATVHVPLVLRLPGVLPAGLRVRGLARTVDLLPTLLDLLGLPLPPWVQGRSLRGAIAAGETDVPFTYFETQWGRLEGSSGVTRQGVSDGRWKLVRAEAPARPGHPARVSLELFDLSRDPEETRDVAARYPEQLRRLSAELEGFVHTYPTGHADVLEPSPELVQHLKALGYL